MDPSPDCAPIIREGATGRQAADKKCFRYVVEISAAQEVHSPIELLFARELARLALRSDMSLHVEIRPITREHER
jgi:hypothetical protein